MTQYHIQSVVVNRISRKGTGNRYNIPERIPVGETPSTLIQISRKDVMGQSNGLQLHTPIKGHFPFIGREKTGFAPTCAEKDTALSSSLSDPDRAYVYGVSVSRGGRFLERQLCVNLGEKKSQIFHSVRKSHYRYRMLLALCVTCDVLKRVVEVLKRLSQLCIPSERSISEIPPGKKIGTNECLSRNVSLSEPQDAPKR
jgi:hypothetical protein